MNPRGGRGAFKDEHGSAHGAWRVIARVDNDRQGGAVWLCRCEECGLEAPIKARALRRGPPRCACVTTGRGPRIEPGRREPSAPPAWRKEASGTVPDHLRALLSD